MLKRLTLSLVSLSLVLLSLCVATSDAADQMRLTLKSRSTVDHDLVTVGDIATIYGGDPRLQKEIIGFDVADFRELDSNETLVLLEQVRIRLLLSGIDQSQFFLGGAKSVVISRDLTREHMTRIGNEVSRAISRSTRLPREDILLKVSSTTDRKLIAGESGLLEFSLPIDGKEAIGRKQIRLAAYRNRKLLKFVDVTIDSKVVMEAPVSYRRIGKGEMFSGESVTFQRRQFDRWPADLVTRTSLAGRFAGRDIQAGQEIKADWVQEQTVANTPKKSVARVKARAPVIVYAQAGPVQIRLNNAVALDSGEAGELIRVRNEATKREMTCEVIDSRNVKVVY